MAYREYIEKKVAPFTGAWIEIYEPWYDDRKDYVAPFTGAWIEINLRNRKKLTCSVAPFTGAWIEIIFVGRTIEAFVRSLPSRERGLKSNVDVESMNILRSLPSRERGLKFFLCLM